MFNILVLLSNSLFISCKQVLQILQPAQSRSSKVAFSFPAHPSNNLLGEGSCSPQQIANQKSRPILITVTSNFKSSYLHYYILSYPIYAVHHERSPGYCKWEIEEHFVALYKMDILWLRKRYLRNQTEGEQEVGAKANIWVSKVQNWKFIYCSTGLQKSCCIYLNIDTRRQTCTYKHPC